MRKFLFLDDLNRMTEEELYSISDFISQFQGLNGAGKPVVTDSTGKIDPSLLDGAPSSIVSRFLALDVVESISYLNPGQKSEVIGAISLSSSSVPGLNLTILPTWLDVGTINERIDFIDYVGPSQTLRKTFTYSLVGYRYRISGSNLAII